MTSTDSRPAPALELDGVAVRYGRHRVLEDVSLSVGAGSVYALLGRNGSGKSSLVRCLLGLQQPARGNARLLSEDSWKAPRTLLRRVGVVPEKPDAPPDLSPGELASCCARLYPRWDGDGFRARLERFSVPRHIPFGKLSRGQQTQVALALALAPEPELLILDDPTLGLDAVARRAVFEELLEELHDHGTSVLLTTHDLAGVETVADRIGILDQGRLALDGDLEELKGRFRLLRFPRAVSTEAVPELATLRPVAVRQGAWGVEAVVQQEALAAPSPTSSSRAEVSGLSLEELFIAVTGQKGAFS